MATKIFRKLNDSKLNETWRPILEAHGADLAKTPWLAEYAHYDAIFRQSSNPIFEQATAPGLFFQQPGSIVGMGAAVSPTSANTPFTGGAKNSYSASGSGDKFPSLLPVAIQVAAKTVGFDLVSVIPMDSPVGFLPYLDYVYAGGQVGSEFEPFIVKIEGLTANTALSVGTMGAVANNAAATITVSGPSATLSLAFVGFSRVDGVAMFKVVSDSLGANSLNTYITAGNTLAFGAVTYTLGAANVPALASALENHISGFTSTPDEDYATSAWTGPYLGATGSVAPSAKRAQGEVSKFRQMGMRMFTKFVEAETDQVAISATVEQIQDFNRVWNFDVISMLENVGINDIAQTINKKLTDKIMELGELHSAKVDQVEGVGITSLSLQAGAGGFENISTIQRRVVTKVLEMANLIFHRGRFGAGTFMVCSGRLATALADVAGYSIAQVPSSMPTSAGTLYPAGKVWGVQVVVDPNLKWSDPRITIGRKGSDEEPGVKFLPYIMAESLQTISEATYSPKIGIKSRYAITEAGWHPETQYLSLEVDGDLGVLTGSSAPSNSSI